MSLHVTTLIAGLLTLMMVPLSVQVSVRRAKLIAAFGDADDELLRRRIRAHGNFVEYVPISLIALGLVEWNGAPEWLVWSVGVATVGSRVVHAYGMLYTRTTVFRTIALVVQHVAFLAAGAWLVFAFDA